MRAASRPPACRGATRPRRHVAAGATEHTPTPLPGARPPVPAVAPASPTPAPLASVAPPPAATSFVAANAAALRAAPLAVGAAGFVAIVANRLASSAGSGALALSAASAQSRADVVALALAAVLALTGLQWATLAPPAPAPAGPLGGRTLDWTHPALPAAAAAELRWAAAAAAAASRSVALVAFVGGVCVAHIGGAADAAEGGGSAADAGDRGVGAAGGGPAAACPSGATPGPVVSRAVETGAGTYLANLVLYPGRLEFTAYLPPGAAGALVAPSSPGGAAIVLATDAVRAFAAVDQAWAAALAEKVDATLDAWQAPQT